MMAIKEERVIQKAYKKNKSIYLFVELNWLKSILQFKFEII